MILFWIAFWLYVAVAGVILFFACMGLAIEVVSRMTGDQFLAFGEEELVLLKQGLLFFWAWPVISAPYVKDIFNSGESA